MSNFDFSDFLNIPLDIEKGLENIKKSEMTAVKLAAQQYANDVKPLLPYITGTLRRSVHVTTEWEGANPVALVGTDAPYARRLEYGFYDIDSLGRLYNQPASPVWRPVWDYNIRKYERMIADKLGESR